MTEGGSVIFDEDSLLFYSRSGILSTVEEETSTGSCEDGASQFQGLKMDKMGCAAQGEPKLQPTFTLER